MDPGVRLTAPEPGLSKGKFILRIPTTSGSGCGWGRVWEVQFYSQKAVTQVRQGVAEQSTPLLGEV